MPTCRGCSRDVADAAALSCPHCGAPLIEFATTAAATVAAAARIGPDDSAPFPPGHVFGGRYRIVSLLGRGATGAVYRADDLRLDQPVALKLLMTPAGYGHETVQRFVREVRLARGVSHPNVCRVYDIGDADGWHYLSMEYVDGETLASLLRRIGRLPHEKALDIARQLCAGLAAAHDRGVLHRDLKPANIMVDGRGRIRIMDFGLAIANDGPSVRDVAGTPGYMAPEQMFGGRITERTDLYALGLVLHEIFAGRRFTADDKTDLHRDVAAIIDRCLEPDPAKRPGSAASIAAILPPADAIPIVSTDALAPLPRARTC